MPKTLDARKSSRKSETVKDSEKAGAAKGSQKHRTARGVPPPKAARDLRASDARQRAGSPGAVPPSVLQDVKKQIVSRFPEMRGVRPSVVRRKVPLDASLVDMIGKIDGELSAALAKMKSVPRKREIYCASFEKEIRTSSGGILQKIVRVTFDKEGHILKLVSSK